MRVEVRGHGVEVSEALREHVERRLAFALDRFRERVESAYAILRDTNGSARRGIDKECRVAIVLRTSGSVAAHARRADLYQAIDVAVGAVGRSLAREVARRRLRSRQPPRPPAGPRALRAAERSAP
jgi:ribosomal subunit interface protein